MTTLHAYTATATATDAHRFELLFVSLFDEGRGYVFPCNADGHVDLDQLSERLRVHYLYVRKLIGRDFHSPAVRPTLQ